MPSARNYIAFDLGAESGRAVLGTLSEGRLELEEKPGFPNPTGRTPAPLHWNLRAQWEELKTGLRKAAGEEAKRPEIHGLGVDTWGIDFGFVFPDGDIRGNPFHYRDPRTNGMLEKAFSLVPKEQIFEQTGVQFMQLNSLYQLLSTKQELPRMLQSAETLLFMPDLFNYLFTGIRKAEFSIATTSQMYDPRKKAWATPMLEAMGLPTRILPEIVPSGTVLG